MLTEDIHIIIILLKKWRHNNN